MADPYLPHPAGWPVTTLVPDTTAGYVVAATSGGTPSTRDESYWDGPFPWLTPKEVARGSGAVFVSRSERTVTEAGLARAGGLLPRNTVMLTKRAPVGCVVVNAVPMASNQGFMSFTCGPRLRPLYQAYRLRANRPDQDKVANASTYPELYLGDLPELHIAVPPLATQDAILAAIRAVDYLTALGRPMESAATSSEELVSIQRDDANLTQLLEHLLPALLSGQLSASAPGPSAPGAA